MMQEFSDRTGLERCAFLAYLQGRPVPRLPRREILLPWAISIALLALQIAALTGVLH
jgi:hypothetical protein